MVFIHLGQSVEEVDSDQKLRWSRALNRFAKRVLQKLKCVFEINHCFVRHRTLLDSQLKQIFHRKNNDIVASNKTFVSKALSNQNCSCDKANF